MPQDAPGLRRKLNSVAIRQAGYFTAEQAREVGYSYQAQKYHVDRGNWTRVDRGIFRIPDWPARGDDVYVLWRLWSRDRAVVSHESALALYELGDVNPLRVHLTVPSGFHSTHPAVVLHPGVLPSEDVEEREGYRLTTPERTLLDAADGDTSQEQLDVAMADAIDRGLVHPRRLRERSDEFGDRAALRIERALGKVAR